MAAITAGGIVRTEQWELCFTVIKFCCVPFHCGMTIIAGRAIAAFVDILNLVAADTGFGCVLIFLIDVAGIAAGFFMREG